ncbi:hypothetical protein ACODG4_09375 [Vagococcus fluvialis]
MFKSKNGEVISYLRIVPLVFSYQETSVGRFFMKKEYRGKGIIEEL